MAAKLNDELVELIVKSAEALKDVPDWAIGGAVAMFAHGVRRHTDDLDIFVEDDQKIAVLRALRVAGFEIIPIMTPIHYMARLPHHSAESRIDVLSPVDDPDVTAIHWAEERSIAGSYAPVFSPEMLVLCKFYSTQDGATDDISRMLNAGIVDVNKLMDIQIKMDPAQATDLKKLLESLSRRTARKRPPRRDR